MIVSGSFGFRCNWNDGQDYHFEACVSILITQMDTNSGLSLYSKVRVVQASLLHFKGVLVNSEQHELKWSGSL